MFESIVFWQSLFFLIQIFLQFSNSFIVREKVTQVVFVLLYPTSVTTYLSAITNSEWNFIPTEWLESSLSLFSIYWWSKQVLPVHAFPVTNLLSNGRLPTQLRCLRTAAASCQVADYGLVQNGRHLGLLMSDKQGTKIKQNN